MTPLHFRTTNGAQAFALALAGFPLIGLRNEYTPEQLAKLAANRNVQSITAREAWQAGEPGTVSYTFERTEELTASAEAYDAEIAILKANGDPTDVPVAQIDVVRIAAVTLAQRKPWADMWKKIVPMITAPHAGEIATRELPDGNLRTSFPGFTSISINAAPEDLALLDKHL